MKKKYGFTLIELLAVIVVLAVIALIAVPIVLDIIEKAKKGAFENSAVSISKAAENYYILNYENKEKIHNKVLGITELEYKGNIKDGTVVFDNKGKHAMIITQDSYCAYKYSSSTKIFYGESIDGACIIDGTPITIQDLITATIEEGEETVSTTVIIESDGKIKYKENNKEYVYTISSDGKMTKDGNEVTTDIDTEYEKLTKGILSSPTATAALLENETLINGFKSNNAALNVMLDGFVDYFNAQAYLQNIEDDVSDIQSKISYINGGTAVIPEGTDTQDKINNYITSLNNVTSKADIIVLNFDKILENESFVNAVFNLEDAKTKLFENDTIVKMMANNEKAVDPILRNNSLINHITETKSIFSEFANSSTFMVKAVENQNFRNAIYENSSVTQSIIASSTVAKNAMKNSSRYETIKATLTTRVNSTRDNVTDIIYNGKAFLFTIKNEGSSTAALIGYFKEGSSKFLENPVTGNIIQKNAFVSTLKGCKYDAGNTVTVTATVFKI